MRAVLGVVALLVVLAIVGFVATRQLRATGQAVGSAMPSSADASSATAAATLREQSQQLQQRVQSDVGKALDAGAAARKEEADK